MVCEPSFKAGSSHWQTFIELLNKDSRIKASTHPHYGRWASHWLKAGGGDSESATKNFFEELGRRKDLKDWQFIQAVSAVELWAKKVAQLDWAKSFDWGGLAA